MAFRKKLSRKKSNVKWKKGLKSHKKNSTSGFTKRGGIRL